MQSFDQLNKLVELEHVSGQRLVSVNFLCEQFGITDNDITSFMNEITKVDSYDGDVQDAPATAGNGGYTIWGGGGAAGGISNPQSTNGGYSGSAPITGSTGSTWYTTGSISSPQPPSSPTKSSSTQNIAIQQYAIPTVTKTKMRYVIIKKDGTTLEMREQPQITAREMIGICKLTSLISTFVGVVLGDVQGVYNINISWSQFIKELSIEKHFVEGMPPSNYNQDDEVLDIFLYDPPQ